MDNHGNYFQSLGIKKIILKFLTKVENFEAVHHKDLTSIKDFVENEYCIPKHLQIYMLYNVEIISNKTLSETFFNHSSTKDKTEGLLTLNLIVKPPNTLQINLCCPYFRFKVSKIGLPDMIEMVETSTLADVERKLSPYDVYVSLPPILPSYDKLSNLGKENCHLFRVARDGSNPNSVELYVCRRIKIKVHSCKTCRLDVKENVFIVDSASKTIRDFIKDEYVPQHGLCCQEVDLRMFKDHPKDITVYSRLIDFPPNVDLNLRAVRSPWRFFRC